jgi:hypothetical protein
MNKGKKQFTGCCSCQSNILLSGDDFVVIIFNKKKIDLNNSKDKILD